ncbi:MAG: uracil-DNA glycosylase [Opitutales bacterium]|nr:uracil-DNA glycosylase [Opitutales bacterium]
MHRELAAVVHELKRLRRQGVDAIPISEETLAQLRKRFPIRPRTELSGAGGAPPPVAASSGLPATTAKPRPSIAKAKPPEPQTPPPPVVTLAGDDKKPQWESLKEQVLSDAFCRSQLKPGKNLVFGVGSLDADIFFCGEAPGAEEEEQSEPFVGPAGKLLTKIIQAMGLSREKVYIGNIMNFRPPLPSAVGNRPPTPEEMAYCLPYLKAQLAIIKPKVVVALGKTAVDGLLGPDPKRRMGQIRGQWQSFEETPLMATYHPSYLLRNESMKAKRMVWEDMLLVMEKVGLPISEKQQGYFK